MANYAIRTNYFRVKDEEQYKALMNLVQCSEDEMDLFTRTGDNGTIYHGFGCYGNIAGIPTVVDAADENGEGESDADLCDADDNDGLDFGAFLVELQDCVAKDDAIIILEAGHDKLQYVGGTATIITSGDIRTLDLAVCAKKLAAEMVADPNWTTVCGY